ncbi:hypothetical protein ABTH20_19640, partial [Acinetobacter baumannii]
MGAGFSAAMACLTDVSPYSMFGVGVIATELTIIGMLTRRRSQSRLRAATSCPSSPKARSTWRWKPGDPLRLNLAQCVVSTSQK